MDDFNCVFRAGKRNRRTLLVGRVSDTSIPLPRLKTVRGTECVSSDMQRSMLFRCGLAHDTNIFDIVHDS